jgi:hypothetical protein
MPWRLLLLLTLLLWPALSAAQCPGITTQLTPYATETLTIAGSVTAFTPAVYQPPGSSPAMAMVTIEGGDIRYQVVGSPSSVTGHHVLGSPPPTLTVCGRDSIASFRVVAVAASASLTVTYYKAKSP